MHELFLVCVKRFRATSSCHVLCPFKFVQSFSLMGLAVAVALSAGANSYGRDD